MKERPKIGEKCVINEHGCSHHKVGEIVEILEHDSKDDTLVIISCKECNKHICHRSRLNLYRPKVEQKLCDCKIDVLMSTGCKCGGK